MGAGHGHDGHDVVGQILPWLFLPAAMTAWYYGEAVLVGAFIALLALVVALRWRRSS